MTADETNELVEGIVQGLEAGVDLAGTLSPYLIPYVVIGRAMDKIVPDLARTVQRWLEGNAPTAEEKAEFKARLEGLNQG